MKFLRVGIYTLIVFGVVTHGGVEEWARAVLEIGAALLFLVWAVRTYFFQQEQMIVPPLLLPLVAFALFVFGQWIFHATASPYLTRLEFQLLLAYLLVLFVAAQAFRKLQDWREFIWFLMIFGFLVSIFGILQHLTFNGKLYWFREMRYGGIPFGPYVNRNHFAGFAELIIPISLVPLALGKVRRERWVIVGVFAIVPICALFLSASRGGIISFGVELVLLAVWMVFRRTHIKQVLIGSAVLILALLMVSWLGVKDILQRFSTMQSLEVTQSKRASMRIDTWHIFLDHPILGTGIGTLQTVYPPYETQYDGKIVNHTHNDYLEALAETGIVGGLCCVWFLTVLFSETVRRLLRGGTPFAVTLQLSGLIACAGLLVHSFVDFNLHIPANAMLFFLIAHLATVEIMQDNSRISRTRHSAAA